MSMMMKVYIIDKLSEYHTSRAHNPNTYVSEEPNAVGSVIGVHIRRFGDLFRRFQEFSDWPNHAIRGARATVVRR